MNQDTGMYYVKTYDNSQIAAVSLQRENLDGTALSRFSVPVPQQMQMLN